MSHESFAVTVRRLEGYRFEVEFDEQAMAPVYTDEPVPLGEGSGPNPTRLLGAAIGNCLAASLLFCLSKARIEVEEIRAFVEGTLVRTEKGRMRVGGIHVRLEPVLADDDGRVDRCLGLFEDFCVVTESVRAGIPIEVTVEPAVPAQPVAA